MPIPQPSRSLNNTPVIMTTSPCPTQSSYDEGHATKGIADPDTSYWKVLNDQPTNGSDKMSKSTRSPDSTKGKAEAAPFEHNTRERDRLSLPSTRSVVYKAPRQRRRSEGQLPISISGRGERIRHLAFLVEMLAAREQLRSLQMSVTAKERRETWINTQEDIDNCISTLLRDSTNLHLDIANLGLSKTWSEQPPPQTAARYICDINAHDDVSYRINRHLREPITAWDEETGQTGKPVRVETALDAYQRGEFSTGQPDIAHLPSGLKPLSPPIKTPFYLDFTGLDRDCDPVSGKHRSGVGLAKESISHDQYHIHPALRTPTRASSTPPKQRSYFDPQHLRPALRILTHPALRYQFPSSSDDDDDDDYWRSTRTSSTLTPSRASIGGGGGSSGSSNPHTPRLIRDGIIPSLPPPSPSPTGAAKSNQTLLHRQLSYHIPPEAATRQPAHHAPLPLSLPTTPTRPSHHHHRNKKQQQHQRLRPTPPHLTPPTPPPTRPPPLLPIEAAKPQAHQSQLLDALLGVPKGRPTKLGEAQEAARMQQDHQSQLLDALLGVPKGEPTRLELLFGDQAGVGVGRNNGVLLGERKVGEIGGGSGGGDRMSIVSLGSGGSLKVKMAGGMAARSKVREGLRRLGLGGS